MRIGVDIRSLEGGRWTGVEEYVFNLLSHLLELDKNNQYVFFGSGVKTDFFSLMKRLGLKKENVELKSLRVPNKFLNTSLKFLKYPKLDKLLGVDLFFAPNINFLSVSSRSPKIITFHDLSFKHFPQFFSLKKRLWHWLIDPKKEAFEAQKIIAVSESTKDDLVNLYGISPEKIEVIYSGLGEEFRPFTLSEIRAGRPILEKKYHLPENFILYLGTIEPRKNIVGLIKAFEVLKRVYPRSIARDLKLVIAGEKGWLDKEIFKAARGSPYFRNIIFTGFVEKKDKPLLYNLAKIFVYPSFFEGFGFPPLEAMASGLPVITSSVSSLPEVMGEAALMVDPYKIDEIAWAMKILLTEVKTYKIFREEGLARAKNFSWEKCARRTLEVLKNV